MEAKGLARSRPHGWPFLGKIRGVSNLFGILIAWYRHSPVGIGVPCHQGGVSVARDSDLTADARVFERGCRDKLEHYSGLVREPQLRQLIFEIRALQDKHLKMLDAISSRLGRPN